MLSLPGYTLYGCIVSALGWILTYNILPETEGRTLEDIELHFSDKSKKLTDRKIPKPKNSISKDELDSNEMATNGNPTDQSEQQAHDNPRAVDYFNSRL